MSPSAPIPPEKRGVAAVLFTLVGFVAGALGMFGGLALLHAPVSHDSSTSGAEHSALDILRDHLPSPAKDCGIGDIVGPAITASSYASVVCDKGPGGALPQVEYVLFHDTISANRQFDAVVTSHPRTMNPQAGDCAQTQHVPGGGAWLGSGEDKVTHILGEGSPEQMATSGGRMICYVDENGLYWIDWVDNDTHIYASASAASENYLDLFKWWESEAGPVHSHPLSHGEMQSASPSM
jgi:hypothetical protein